MTRRKNIVLHLFTELKTLHSSYSLYKRNLQLFESTSFPSIPQSLFCWIFFSFWSILLLFWSTAIFLLVRSFCCINWVDKVSRPFQALAFSSFGLLSEQMTKGSKRQLKKLLMWANHLINSNHHVVILPHRYSTTVSLETYPLFCILCFWCYLIIVLYHTTIFYSGTKRMTMEKILLG